MNKKQYDKVKPKSVKEVTKKMRKVAMYTITNEWLPADGTVVTNDDLLGMAGIMSYAMAMGSNISKRKYLIRGAIVGSVITFGVMKAREIIKDQGEEA